MPNTGGGVPGRDADFEDWFKIIVNKVSDKTSGDSPDWDHIPRRAVTDLIDVYTMWRVNYEKTLGPHSPTATEAKNNSRAKAEAMIRPFIIRYLNFDPVTNEDRVAMGLHNKDLHHTPINPPATRPIITDLSGMGGYRVEVRFRDETTPDSRAIPYGDNGCLLNYTWGSERITDVSKLDQTTLMTRSPCTITFPPESQSFFLSCAPRWQNKKGELGPWGDIHYVVIG
jgi:hypothetical protein